MTTSAFMEKTVSVNSPDFHKVSGRWTSLSPTRGRSVSVYLPLLRDPLMVTAHMHALSRELVLRDSIHLSTR